MTNTFIRKVDAERKVLRIVNDVTSGPRQLAGLSANAIDSWRQRAGIPGADDISQSLLQIAGLCQLLSNRSHENFNSLDPALMQKIDEELVGLRLLLEPAIRPAGTEAR